MKKNNDLIKGSLVIIILELLAEQGRMYGYQIMKEVEKRTSGNLILTEGALYQALYKLESEGKLYTSTEHEYNRPRKYYGLTHTGVVERDMRKIELEGFIHQLQSIFNFKLSIK